MEKAKMKKNSTVATVEYERLFGHNFLTDREDKLRAFSSGGFLTIDSGRLRLTHEGFYVSNSILADLL